VNEVQVAHRGIYQSLEGRRPKALEDPGREKTVIAPRSPAPSARPYQQHGSEDEQMPLAPDPGGRDGQYAGNAHAQQKVSCQDGDLCKGGFEDEGERQGIGGKDRAEGGGEDRGDGEDDENDIALPEGPILEREYQRRAITACGAGVPEGRWGHRWAVEPR
jgi:hypothetical protein